MAKRACPGTSGRHNQHVEDHGRRALPTSRQGILQLILCRRPDAKHLSERAKSELLPVSTMAIPSVSAHLRANVKTELWASDLSQEQVDFVATYRDSLLDKIDDSSSAAATIFPSDSQEDRYGLERTNKAILAALEASQRGRQQRLTALPDDVKEQLLWDLIKTVGRLVSKGDQPFKQLQNGGGAQMKPVGKPQMSGPKGSAAPYRGGGAMAKYQDKGPAPAPFDDNACLSCWNVNRPFRGHSMDSCTLEPWGALCIACIRLDKLEVKKVRHSPDAAKYTHKLGSKTCRAPIKAE